MADYIIEGKKGSGKTYYAMWHITNKYYVWNDHIKEFTPIGSTLIISNIDDLKLEHVNLDDLIKEHGMEKVFSREFMDALRTKYSARFLILVIDECQGPDYFHAKYYNPNVFLFFQKSRHWGVDTYFITQDTDTVCKQIRVLPELTIHAVSRSNAIGKSFRYKTLEQGDMVGMKILKIDKRIFKFYSSYKFEESERPKSQVTKFYIAAAVMLILTVVGFKYVFIQRFVGHGASYAMNGTVTPNGSTVAKNTIPVYGGNIDNVPKAIPAGSALPPSKELPAQPVVVSSDTRTDHDSADRSDGGCHVQSVTVTDGIEISSSYCVDGSIVTTKNGRIIRVSHNRNEVKKPDTDNFKPQIM